jgi:hypothetical protein
MALPRACATLSPNLLSVTGAIGRGAKVALVMRYCLREARKSEVVKARLPSV